MLFGLHVAIPVFGLTDACSKTTQSVQSTALGSQQAMNHTAAMLREIKIDEAFSGYYTSCTTLTEQLGVAPPIRRFVRPPRKIDEGNPACTVGY